MSDYEHTIAVRVSPKRAFDALTQDMSSWWTEMTSTVARVGDTTTAKFEDGTTWSFEVIALEQDKLVEFRCYDANHVHPVTTPAMRTEWANTVLRFEISDNANHTSVHFTHLGLTQEKNCYGICRAGWDHFFGSAFKAYLDKLAADNG